MHKAYNYSSQRNEKQPMCHFVWIDISIVHHWLDISLVRELQPGFYCSRELVHFTGRFNGALSGLHPGLYLCDRHKNSHEAKTTEQQVELAQEGFYYKPTGYH